MSVSKRWVVPALLGVCLSTQGGCLTLSALMGNSKSPTLDTSYLKRQGYSIPPGGMPAPVAPDPQGAPRVVLEVRDGEVHLESIPLAMDRPVFIEDIVQQARLHDRFGQLVISIMRPSDSGGPPIRLETKTNDAGKAMTVGQNYALHPGDHIIVNSDNRSGLERLVDRYFRNHM